MENREIKAIWDTHIEQKIERYLDAQLEEMILKNARMAIGTVYGGKWGVGKLLVLLLIVAAIVFKNGHAGMGKFWIVVALIYVAVVMVQWYSQRKMERYRYDKPLKEWIGSRIQEFDRSIRLKKRLRLLVNGIGLAVLSAMLTAMVLLTEMPTKELIVTVIAGVVFMVFVAERTRHLTLKRMTEARDRLLRISEQLEE